MCEVDYMHLGLSLPALRGSQGGRALYVALPSNSVIDTFFPTHVEGSGRSNGSQVDDEKVDAIASYVADRSDGFVLGAITYATDSECVFEEAFPGAQFGILRLPLNAKLRSIDGHHRREALRVVVDRLNAVGSQHTALLLYVEPRLDRRRLMFEDMNRHDDRPASVDDGTANPFRTAAEELAREHPFLVGRVTLAKRQGKRQDGDFTLDTVIDCLKRLEVGPTGRVKEPGKYRIQDVRDHGWVLFDALAEARAANPTDAVALSWPVTLRVVAGAWWTVARSETAASTGAIQRALRVVDFTSHGPVWRDSGICEEMSQTARTTRQTVLAAVGLLSDVIAAAARARDTGGDERATGRAARASLSATAAAATRPDDVTADRLRAEDHTYVGIPQVAPAR